MNYYKWTIFDTMTLPDTVMHCYRCVFFIRVKHFLLTYETKPEIFLGHFVFQLLYEKWSKFILMYTFHLKCIFDLSDMVKTEQSF